MTHRRREEEAGDRAATSDALSAPLLFPFTSGSILYVTGQHRVFIV